jgi:hypothetical protein
LKEANIQFLDNSYSVGFLLGNFLENFKSFKKAPRAGILYSLASLALGCGMP